MRAMSTVARRGPMLRSASQSLPIGASDRTCCGTRPTASRRCASGSPSSPTTCSLTSWTWRRSVNDAGRRARVRGARGRGSEAIDNQEGRGRMGRKGFSTKRGGGQIGYRECLRPCSLYPILSCLSPLLFVPEIKEHGAAWLV